MNIYKTMGKALLNAKATPMQAHLAFVTLGVNGLASALDFIAGIKERNEKREHRQAVFEHFLQDRYGDAR